jgi:hypothetical protein
LRLLWLIGFTYSEVNHNRLFTYRQGIITSI